MWKKNWLWPHSFYDSGYQDGFAHGRIHGLIEGRALGREKGFEMWEEIGFYEGFALTWRAILRQQSKEDELSLTLPKRFDFVIWFVVVVPPSTSDIYLNISPNFHALTHPVQTTTLLPHLIYQNFYARFDLDTRPSAQFLVSILDLDLLTKDPTKKTQENQICKSTNRRKILLFLYGESITLERKNWWQIRISVSEINLPLRHQRWQDFTYVNAAVQSR